MATDFVRVSEPDLEKWGRLVKTLATGIDHRHGNLELTDGVVTGPPVPATPDTARLRAAIARIRARQDALAAANANPATAVPPMLSRAEFRAVLEEQLVPLSHDPDTYDWVEFGQTHGRVLSIRLPCSEVILEKQGAVMTVGGYGVQMHVQDWVLGIGRDSPPSLLQQLTLNDRRVGSYSIAHCEG